MTKNSKIIERIILIKINSKYMPRKSTKEPLKTFYSDEF